TDLPVPIQPLAATTPLRRRWLPWAVAASLVLAVAGGAALAFLQPVPKAPTYVQPPPAKSPEQKLQEEAERYNGASTLEQKNAGLQKYQELALFYLEQKRLDDAEELFANKLEKSASVPAYRQLGQLGRALVLAFRDEPAKSNQKFLEWLRK